MVCICGSPFNKPVFTGMLIHWFTIRAMSLTDRTYIKRRKTINKTTYTMRVGDNGNPFTISWALSIYFRVIIEDILNETYSNLLYLNVNFVYDIIDPVHSEMSPLSALVPPGCSTQTCEYLYVRTIHGYSLFVFSTFTIRLLPFLGINVFVAIHPHF